MSGAGRQKILEFMKGHDIGVIATVDSAGKPEAAVVEYGETDNLELILDTFVTSRKYKNLLQNPLAAFVIGWDENITLQCEGTAQELQGAERKECKRLYFQKNKRAQKWEGREGITYMKLTPRWMRYSNLNKDPWEIFEIMI